MSFKGLGGKLVKPNLIKFKIEEFNVDKDAPQRLRDSLFSTSLPTIDGDEDKKEIITGKESPDVTELCVVDESGDFHLANRPTEEINNDIWELAPDFGENEILLKSSSEADLSGHTSSPMSSSMTLIRKVSSMSMFWSTEQEQGELLMIARLVPLQNQAGCIIHWDIKSTYGIAGYEVSFTCWI